MREPTLGDIYREETEEKGMMGGIQIKRGSLYEVTEANPRRIRLKLWDGPGASLRELSPVELSSWNLWRSGKWASLAQFS